MNRFMVVTQSRPLLMIRLISIRPLPKPPLTGVVKISKDGDPAASLDHLLQCLTTELFPFTILCLMTLMKFMSVALTPIAVCTVKILPPSPVYIDFHGILKKPGLSWASSSPDWKNLGLSAFHICAPACQMFWWFYTPVFQYLWKHKSVLFLLVLFFLKQEKLMVPMRWCLANSSATFSVCVCDKQQISSGY